MSVPDARGRRPVGPGGELLVDRLGLDLRRRSAPRVPAACAGRRPSVAQPHLRHLNPFPEGPRRRPAVATTRVLVPEMNLGQLALLLRARYLVDAVG